MNCSKWFGKLVIAVGVYMITISTGAGINQAFASGCAFCGGTPVCATLSPLGDPTAVPPIPATPCTTGACTAGPYTPFCETGCACNEQRTGSSCTCAV